MALFIIKFSPGFEIWLTYNTVWVLKYIACWFDKIIYSKMIAMQVLAIPTFFFSCVHISVLFF